MRSSQELTSFLDSILERAESRDSAGETEWLEFKTNIGESHTSITYERLGDYLSGLANAACIKDVAYAYLIPTLLAQNPNLTINDVEILSRVLLKRNVSTTEIDHLRKLKLIEGRKPNVYISKNVAQTVGKKVTYTKIKGFNDKYYKDLICQALEQHGQLGRKEFEELLIDKLPDALSQEKKVHKVGNLLTSLRKKGLIKVNSSNKWILSEIKHI